jgi:DNA-binding response OmpR family regulator
VLVADDDADIVRFVEVNLRLEGFQVVRRPSPRPSTSSPTSSSWTC